MTNFRSRAARNKTKKMRILHIVPSYRQLLFGGRIFAVHDISFQSIFVELHWSSPRSRAKMLSVEVVG